MTKPKTEEATAPPKRRYHGGIQAEVAALTHQRILDAMLALAEEQWLDQITLDQVAARAGVTVQTVIRHFGTKEHLFAAAGQEAHQRAKQQRDEAPVADIAGAVRNLMDHYEDVGRRVLRVLAQEERYPALKPLLDAGRTAHRSWVERTFAPFLAQHEEPTRAHLLAQLVAVTDVYIWKLLRHDNHLSTGQTERALQDMLTALLQCGIPASHS